MNKYSYKLLFVSCILSIQLFSATFTVTNNGDSGVGSLRQAIIDANSTVGTHNIVFSSNMTITLLSNLPTLNSNITVDGGATANTAAVFGGTLNPVYRITITSSLADILMDIGNSSNCVIKGIIFLNTAATGTAKLINISAGSNNQIIGCYIGTSGTTAGASNATYGVYINGGANNTVGDGTKAGANVISGIGNYGYGVYITGAGATGNTIKGNIIGLRANGTTLMTHFQKYGVYITSGAGGNTIGGTGAEDGNVISGQYGQFGTGTKHYGAGIFINSTAIAGNTIVGNRIGMSTSGASYITSNTQAFGIQIYNSRNNTIGGNTAAHRNVVSGNEYWGIYIHGASSTGNSIKGNYVGCQANGTTFLTNSTQNIGILFRLVGANNIIGGTGAGEGNVISGAATSSSGFGDCQGVCLLGSSGVTFTGNIVGLQSDGNTNLISNSSASQYYGILIDSASANNIIGGNTAAHRNIISGNRNNGLTISGNGSTGNQVKGNYFGLQSDGITQVVSNIQGYGIFISDYASNNTIGGTAYSDRNIISGHNAFGIYFTSYANSNTVSANIIGLDKNGNAIPGHTQTRGIQFQDAANNNVIGGSTVVERNYISGNSTCGIMFVSQNGVTINSTGNIFKGNYIGTDTTGNLKITNQGWGIFFGDTGLNNTVGGTGANEGNVISGNGVGIETQGASNTIVGNIIGPQKDGITYIASNSQTIGIKVNNTSGTIIGGNTSAHRNIISSNIFAGVQIEGAAATGTIVKGNYLGPGATLSQIVGATQNYGVYILNSANNNTIGGVLAGEANIMAFNNVNGSMVTGAATIRNKISGSPHYSNNNQKPINLTYGASGGNNNQPIPVIANATTAVVSGTALPGDVVEVFKSLTGNCFDANVYLGAATANGSGNWSLPVTLANGDVVLATARDANNNTSEFSLCKNVCPTSYAVSNPVICSNTSYVLPGGASVNTSGTYYDTLISAAGCDSIITTTLTVNPSYALTQNISLCQGQSITVGGNTYNTTGNYVNTLQTINGCDSVITTNLTIKPVFATTQNVNLCFGQSYTVGSNTYTNSGTYTDNFTAINGCDSVVTTNLTIDNQITFSQNITICNGDSVLVGSTYYFNSGTYTTNLIANNGCDSIVTTTVVERPDVTSSQSITMCFGDSILVGSTYYYNSGTYINIFTDINGCDSTVTTNLTERPANTFAQNVTICFGDSVQVGSVYYYNSGTYIDSLIDKNGCDSVITTSIIERPLNTFAQNVTICFGDSLQVGNIYYSSTGTYIDTLSSIHGCDSIITTNLTEVPFISVSQNITMCFGDSIQVGNTFYYNSGSFIDTLTAINGCDSVVSTVLTEKPLNQNGQTLTLCAGQSVTVGNNTYNATGVYTDVFTGVDGCDSLYITNLTIIQPVVTQLDITLPCKGDTYTMPNGGIIDSTGVYNDTLPAANGCDSIVTVVLNYSPAPVASFTASPTSGVAPLLVSFTNTSQNANTYQWTFGDGNSSTLPNPTNTYMNSGSYLVMLVASNGSWCNDTAYETIIVHPPYDILVPNVFTPNNDGNNDMFMFPNEGIKTLYCEIYDRWGLKMYEWYGTNGGWDGYTSSGLPAPDGTYYYIYKATDYNDKEYAGTGFFTLIRTQ